MSDFTSYQSPFSWRYGSDEMRSIWSERNKRLLWRKLWAAMAETQWVLAAELQELFKVEGYTGIAESRALTAAVRIREHFSR